MSRFHDKAVELRKDLDRHHNCAETLLLTFAEDAGVSDEIASKVSSNFGRGMKMAATCGVLTGGLMVLGLFGIDDQQTVNEYYLTFKRKHEGNTDCADLLKASYAKGIERKVHCDGLVYEGVAALEEILKKRNLIHE